MLNIYIGYDAKFGDAAFRVCDASLRHHASVPVNVVKLSQDWLRRIGLYRRQFYVIDGQSYDAVDQLPFSTEFAFSRFLAPCLQPEGWALFCDSDFLFRADVAELFEAADPRKAAMVVKHEQEVDTRLLKMHGQVQAPYSRKNWSSLVLWNCGHPSNRMLTPFVVNTFPGRWLHQFGWLQDAEIGDLEPEWNWLDGYDSLDVSPKAVHFTRGTPDMPGWEDTRYAPEWMETWSSL